MRVPDNRRRLSATLGCLTLGAVAVMCLLQLLPEPTIVKTIGPACLSLLRNPAKDFITRKKGATMLTLRRVPPSPDVMRCLYDDHLRLGRPIGLSFGQYLRIIGFSNAAAPFLRILSPL